MTTTTGNLLGIITGSFGTAAGNPSSLAGPRVIGVAAFSDAGTDSLRGDYILNITGGSNNVTGSGSGTNGTSCSVTEFSERPTASALGSVNHAIGTSTTIQTGSITPALGSDLMVGSNDDGTGNSASTIDSSFTVDEVGGANTVWDRDSGAAGGSAHLDNAAASPVNPTWTSAHVGVGHMTALIMEFRVASMPPGLGPALQMQPAHTLTIGW